MHPSSRFGLLVLCLLLSGTTRLLVVATGNSDNRINARIQSTYFTADFLSSHAAYDASRHFDSPCADRVYASERDRSLRYLFGPTMGKAMNYWTYLKSTTKSQFQLTVELSVELYLPFPAGMVYAHLKNMSPAVNLDSTVSRRELTTALDAYISMPSPFADQIILSDLTDRIRLEIVFFKTASKPREKMKLNLSFILEQIEKTGLLEQGRQIRRQQMIAAYLGRDHTQRTYSQRVLEESKPLDGEEVYWLKLPRKSGPIYPGLFKDSQWTFELVIKFLTYAIPALPEDHENRSRVRYFNHYLNNSGIIPGIDVSLVLQPFDSTFPLFTQAFVQSQKYCFLETNSTLSAVLYRESFIGGDVLSPPIHRFIDAPGILLGARRTLLKDNDTIVCAVATIDFAVKRSVKASSLRRLKMPFRIPKGLVDEAAKRGEALRRLAEVTELNGLEEDFDLEERILALIPPNDI